MTNTMMVAQWFGVSDVECLERFPQADEIIESPGIKILSNKVEALEVLKREIEAEIADANQNEYLFTFKWESYEERYHKLHVEYLDIETHTKQFTDEILLVIRDVEVI
jgi:hypothetical protein